MLEARILRKNGTSIKQIAIKLKVSVSSVSVWCRDILFTEDQKKHLRAQGQARGYEARMDTLKKRKNIFDNRIKQMKTEAKNEIGALSMRDLFVAGIALYWGEGFKKDHLVGLATTDKNIAMFYITWLKCCFNVASDQLILRVTINEKKKHLTTNIINWWSSQLGISSSQFSKPYFQKSIWKKEYENENEYHGVIRIKVRRSINLLRKILGYIEGLHITQKIRRSTVDTEGVLEQVQALELGRGMAQ